MNKRLILLIGLIAFAAAIGTWGNDDQIQGYAQIMADDNPFDFDQALMNSNNEKVMRTMGNILIAIMVATGLVYRQSLGNAIIKHTNTALVKVKETGAQIKKTSNKLKATTKQLNEKPKEENIFDELAPRRAELEKITKEIEKIKKELI